MNGSESAPEFPAAVEQVAAVLAEHYPHLFRCSCGGEIRTRLLPDVGEREAIWAEHVAPLIVALKETP